MPEKLKARARRVPSPEALRRVLRRTFGLERLRPGQEAVIARALRGLSTLALMPTGAGKSLCYQLPAVLLDGITVVVSPLIALMKDQADALAELGIATVQWHGSLSAAELGAAQQALEDGRARVVFTTPEQLARPEVVQRLTRRRVALLVVDEAHCLSQWGFDFRPAFLAIGPALKALGEPPVLALTATATAPVVDDIVGQLGIPRAGVIGTDLFRPNLHYRAEVFSRAEDKQARLVELVERSEGSGLVYVATVKAAEAVHAALAVAQVSVGLYHGRLPAARRHAAQDAFMDGAVRVMVATNAFGLGIDKPDIRFVVHHQMPGGLDAYYQESGRAGRDGGPAVCTLLFVEGDRQVQQFFLAGRSLQWTDLRRVLDTLDSAPPSPAGWRLDVLAEALGQARRTTLAATLLRQAGWVTVDAAGQYRRVDGAPADEAGLAPLVAAGEARTQQDREGLERMVTYAQGGQCRWRMLLEHLEGGPAIESCGSCDNCLRLAELAASAPEPVATAEPQVPLAGPRFAPGDRVRTRRHGPAQVVAVDATGVTVAFDNGQTRSFLPEFLSAMRPRRAARRADANAAEGDPVPA